MDFLRDVKAKLEELEEFSKQAQGMMQESGQKELFQPKQGLGSRMKAALEQASGHQQFEPRAQERQEQTRSSRRPVDSQECPVEDWAKERTNTESSGPSGGSIFDNLSGRLDEAFLLQEVLGPPRCMREWE